MNFKKNIEHHLEERIDCPIMKSNKLQVCKILKHFAPNLVDGLSEEDILKICGILDSNSFRIDKHGSRGKIIFPPWNQTSKIQFH